MVEQDAREKKLKAEIQSLRARLQQKLKAEIQSLRARLQQGGGGGGFSHPAAGTLQALDDGGGGGGGFSHPAAGTMQALDDVEEQSKAMLKRMRRDMLMQEVLLGEVLATVRDEDLEDQIALLKDCMGTAADGEGALAQAGEDVLHHVDKGTDVLDHVDRGTELKDEEATNLRHSLTRILGSIGMARRARDSKGTELKDEEATNLRQSLTRILGSIGMGDRV
ncbi:hypothetical protein T484DRAFT_1776826 [Baffinella frigidus]|nr:hypothetical protein T484DRAFT_1776826 [Cryptophyta sp. CCMP2293]